MVFFKTINYTQNNPSPLYHSAIIWYNVSFSYTSVFLLSRHSIITSTSFFYFHLSSICHTICLYGLHSLTLLPLPPLQYAEKHIPDGSTNPGSLFFFFFFYSKYMAETDNASDIINIEVKRGVKWAWYLLAPLWMTWLHPGDLVWWRTNPQIWFPV